MKISYESCTCTEGKDYKGGELENAQWVKCEKCDYNREFKKVVVESNDCLVLEKEKMKSGGLEILKNCGYKWAHEAVDLIKEMEEANVGYIELKKLVFQLLEKNK